ncbi:MAG: Uma2 family endonuclease [Bacteroidota bacterium]
MNNIAKIEQSFLVELFKYGPILLEQPLSIAEFNNLYAQFPELLMEREANGKVSIMSPVKRGSGRRESVISGYLFMWLNEYEQGEMFSPSTGIELPTGAIKSPDATWVSDERLAAVSQDEEHDYLKAVPDFIAEVRSVSDRISKLKKKMEKTWMANGVRLGWLIDPYGEKVWIYREEQETEIVEGFEGKVLSGEELMPGFELPLEKMKVNKV